MPSSHVIKLFLATMLLFSAIYVPKFGDMTYPAVIYILIPAAIYTYIKSRRLLFYVILNKHTLVFFSWLSILIIYSLFVSIYLGDSQDFSIPYNYSIWLIFFIFPIFISSILITDKFYFNNGFKFIALITALQAVFILSAVMYSPIREFFGELINGNGLGHLKGWELRVQGISGSGGAALAIIQAIGASVSLFLFFRTRQKMWLFISAVTLLSAMPVGRSGIIWYLIFFSFFVPFYIFKKNIFINFSYSLLAIGLGSAVILFYISEIEAIQVAIDFIVTWGLEPLRFITNPSEDETIRAISDMWTLPINFDNYLFGSGWHIIEGENLVGDPGYLRYFYFFGFIGVFLHYSFFLWLASMAIKNQEDRQARYFVTLLFALLFIFEFKEPFTMKVNSIFFFIFFYFIARSCQCKLNSILADSMGSK